MSNRPDVSYAKHILMSETKKIFKELFGKGPEKVTLRLAGDVIVLEFFGFLRSVETQMIKQCPEKARIIRAYRKAIFEYMEDVIIQRVEELLGCGINKLICDVDMFANTATCLVMLDREL